MNTISVKPKFIHKGLFKVPLIQYKSELPKYLKDEIDREEFEEILEKIETFYNPKYEHFFDTVQARAFKNIPICLIPIVNIVNAISIAKQNQLELSIFENDVVDYIQELCEQHYFQKRGLKIITSWDTVLSRYGIIPYRRRELRITIEFPLH